MGQPVDRGVAEPAEPDCDQRSHHPARDPDARRLREKQQQHVARSGSESLQHSDLFRSFEHRGVHGVGDAKTGEQQRDDRQAEQRDPDLAEQILEIPELVTERLGLKAQRIHAPPEALHR